MQTVRAPRSIALDPTRIASLSGAIAANALVLLLLLVPMAAPVIEHVRDPVVFPIDPPKPKLVPPPTPPTPPRAVKIKPAAVPVIQPARQIETRSDLPPQVVNDSKPGDVAAQPASEAVAPQPEVLPPGDGKPMTGAHLQYASAPAPAYPRESLVAGETGVVMLEVLVDVDGRPIEVTISRSSGHRRLDVAARRQVLSKWRFRPAMRNGQPVQAIGIVPVEFTLNQ